MDNSSRKAWERRPDETDKSFDAFQKFLAMPIKDIEDPSKNRTLANLSVKLNYAVAEGKAASTIEGWSTRYDWLERARLYDMHKAELNIQVRDASLEQYQKEVIERRTLQTTLLNESLEIQIADVMKRQKSGYPVDALEILRLANAAQKLDDLERRIGGMPTDYKTEKVEDDNQTNHTRTFIVGAK